MVWNVPSQKSCVGNLIHAPSAGKWAKWEVCMQIDHVGFLIHRLMLITRDCEAIN